MLQEQQAQVIRGRMDQQLQRSKELAQEKGSSAWLTVLPMTEHGFLLHKGEFRDALCLRYGWNLSHLPRSCTCGMPFSVDHAMICPLGGIPTIRHNEIRDITATLLTETCHNVATERLLQPLTNESFTHRSAHTAPNARLDIRARGFWNTGQDAFFAVRVFHPNVSSNRLPTMAAAYRKHETTKKREDAERVREVERAVFTPLVLSTTGGMGHEAIKTWPMEFHGRRESNLQSSWGGFDAVSPSQAPVRGSSSSRHCPTHKLNIPLAASEGRVPSAMQ